MILFGEDKYKSGLKEMWKLCFPMDTGIFIDFYFDEVYKNDETLVYFENGKPVAAFQMIPYALKNGGEISQAAYISGAMTHPDFRRKGFMKELLFASFDIMQGRGFDYTFLIPQEAWLFDFYAKFGYKTTLPPGNLANQYENVGPDVPYQEPCTAYRTPLFTHKTIPHEVYIVYSRFLSEIPQVVLKTEKQFQQILRDFFDENGVWLEKEPDFPGEHKGMIRRLNPAAEEITTLWMGMMLD
ncbi:MAG: GNAT family N-acetyltransferase [Dysgonamonadaceae bacterium]|jgi:GNAT superfamily N-acetyltransferase|nr:GNAT family N-acetyltransferase [Dysgonamonadaceae bacterium]